MLKMLLDSLIYVANQNMFWGAMGFTTAMAMFIGVILYDGNVNESRKGIVAVLIYAGMILWTTSIRVIPNAVNRNFIYSNGRPFATIATVIYITIAWVIGIYIGVNFFKHKKFKE